MPSRSEPISSSSSSSSSLTSSPNDSFPLSELLEESTVKKVKGERERGRGGGRDGRREGGLKQCFHRGYHQIGQGTVYTKLHGRTKL